jgi:hypothetical protein
MQKKLEHNNNDNNLELGAYMQLSETVPSANMSRSSPTALAA